LALAAAAAGGEPEPLAALLVGAEEPLPVLLGVELAEPLLCGAVEDELPSVDPDF
jgi:hypothetical protein